MCRELKYGSILLLFFVCLSLLSAHLLSNAQANTALELLFQYSTPIDLNSDGVGMLLGILFKNLLACALVALCSRLAYGLTIYMFVLVNAVVLGIVFSTGGWSWETLSYFIPHAPVELIAIMLSLGMGWRILRSGETPSRYDITLFARTIFPLLLLAAVLETYFTPVFIALAN